MGMNASSRRRARRETRAIHMYFTRDMTQQEIADELGVSQSKVSEYVNSEPSEQVKEMIDHRAAQVRVMSLEELRTQLREAGERARTAEAPVKVWTDSKGFLRVNDKRNPETGELTGRYPVPADFEMGPDHETRYYARDEIRDILEHMEKLVGAREPEQVEVSGGGITIYTEATDGDD